MVAALARIHPEAHPSLSSLAGIPVRQDTLYTNAKGQEKKDIRQRAERDIGQLQHIVRRVLDREEAVLYVARCEVRPSLIDQFTAGFYARYFSRIALVLTNRRLLYFFVNRDGSWKRSLRFIPWGDVETARIKSWINRTLTVRFHNGRKEAYWRIRRVDANKIRVLLAAILPGASGGISALESPVSLCPECLATLTPDRYQCTGCGLRFKDEETLLRRVLLIPGGGYFYTGQMWAGVLQLAVDLYLIAMVISAVVFYRRVPAPREVVARTGQATSYLAAAALFGAGLLLEKWGAFHHCRKVIRRFIPGQGAHKAR